MASRVKPIILVGDQPMGDFFHYKKLQTLKKEDKEIDTHVLMT